MDIEMICEYAQKCGALFVFSGLGGAFVLDKKVKRRRLDDEVPLYSIAVFYLIATISLLLFIASGCSDFVGIGFALIFAATFFLTVICLLRPWLDR